MPQTDMPLEQLKTYRGINPKPEDFDAYWDRALEELNSTDPQISLEPADFTSPFADCFDLRFTGVGGARIYAKMVVPKMASGAKREPGPALLNFHGYTANSGDWVALLPYAAAGFVILAMDCRGQGGRSTDPGGNTLRGHIIRGLDYSPEDLHYRQIYLDTVELAHIAFAMEEVDENRVGAFGRSQGGALTLACAALEPRIKRLAPVFPFLCDFKRVWEMDLGQDAYRELFLYFRHLDPRHEREEEIFRTLGYVDNIHLASRIKGAVLMSTGLVDEICPPSTQFAAYNRILSEKQMDIYPDYGHETIPQVADRTFQFMLEL